jgi:ribonuclease HI
LSNIKVYTDGASRGNPGKSGIGIVIYDGNDTILKTWNEYIGVTTNNQAEYKALLRSLDLAREIVEERKLKLDRIDFYADSELMVKQLKGEYKVKDAKLLLLYNEFRAKLSRFGNRYTITHVDREHNKEADKLANQAIDNKNSL